MYCVNEGIFCNDFPLVFYPFFELHVASCCVWTLKEMSVMEKVLVIFSQGIICFSSILLVVSEDRRNSFDNHHHLKEPHPFVFSVISAFRGISSVLGCSGGRLCWIPSRMVTGTARQMASSSRSEQLHRCVSSVLLSLSSHTCISLHPSLFPQPLISALLPLHSDPCCAFIYVILGCCVPQRWNE